MKNMIAGQAAKILYLPLLCLLANGCSYYGGQLSYFDITDHNKKAFANRKATEKFWASVRPKSNLSDAHYRLGLHYQQMGEYDKAIAEFDKALRNDRSYCKALNGIAMTYDLQKKCEPAHITYEQAVKCAPDKAYMYNNYACSSMLCGNNDKSIELLQKAEQLASGDARIKNNLRIAQSIAIRENFSEYLSKNLPLTTPTAKALPDNEKALPEGRQAVVPGDSTTASQRDLLAKPAEQPTPPAERTATEPTIREIAPALQQEMQIAHLSARYKKKIEMSVPVDILPVPGKVAVEVANGNGTAGMAKRSADFLRSQGFTIRCITNAASFGVEESVIYYQKEFLQMAKDLAAVIPGTQQLEKVETKAETSGVKVVLGKDLAKINFPKRHAGLAGYQQTKQLHAAVITASNQPVQY